MNKSELIEKLEKQLEALRCEGPFDMKSFKVWWMDENIEKILGESIIRKDVNNWSWGHCRSETCNHNSHDPYQEGDTIWISCKTCGEDENGHVLFVTKEGVVFGYRYANDCGYHFAPTATIFIP